MIRFRLGAANGDAPTTGDGPAAPRAGAIHIEVDGVEVSGGGLEADPVAWAISLAEAIASLLRAEHRSASIALLEGRSELIFARRGAMAELSIVHLGRPARVRVDALALELEELAQAARASADELLAAADPGSDEHRRLATAQRALRTASARPSECTDRNVPERLEIGSSTSGPVRVVCRLDDRDGRLAGFDGGSALHAVLVPGALELRASHAGTLAAADGLPFLRLRELVRSAGHLLAARRDGDRTFELALGASSPTLRLALREGTVTAGDATLPCAAHELAQAIFEAALALVQAVAARSPKLAGHPHLAALQTEARDGLRLCRELSGDAPVAGPVDGPAPPAPRPASEGAPLAPGALRRVSVSVRWRGDLGPVRSVVAHGPSAWLLGEERATCLRLSDGRVRTTLEGRLQGASGPPRAPVLLEWDDGRLAAFAASGATLWVRRPVSMRSLPARYVEVESATGERLAVGLGDGAGLFGLALATGRPAYWLLPPAARQTSAAVDGRVALLAADNGLVYGIDAGAGLAAWRARLDRPPFAVALSGDLAVLVVPGDGGLVAVGLEAASGQARFERPLLLESVGALMAVRGGTIVSGAGPQGGEVLQLDAAGRIRWRARPLLGTVPPALTRAGAGLFARGHEGICRIERGKVRWNVPCGPGGAPVVVRGVVALPGDELALLDAASGRSLLPPEVRAGLPHADHVLPAERDGLVLVDAQGPVAGLKLAGAIAVV